MGGGWIGYVYTIVGCGSVVAVVLVSVLMLYVVARVRARRQPAARVQVSAVSRVRDDRSGAA